ncbi:hypothetical protein K438DRAFT_1962599 [Mycena galopus ATCC 62051]|nr:hypothetical protein K438DRAFT_1962599 [Mycena galopus ATCC 62051]
MGATISQLQDKTAEKASALKELITNQLNEKWELRVAAELQSQKEKNGELERNLLAISELNNNLIAKEMEAKAAIITMEKAAKAAIDALDSDNYQLRLGLQESEIYTSKLETQLVELTAPTGIAAIVARASGSSPS